MTEAPRLRRSCCRAARALARRGSMHPQHISAGVAYVSPAPLCAGTTRPRGGTDSGGVVQRLLQRRVRRAVIPTDAVVGSIAPADRSMLRGHRLGVADLNSGQEGSEPTALPAARSALQDCVRSRRARRRLAGPTLARADFPCARPPAPRLRGTARPSAGGSPAGSHRLRRQPDRAWHRGREPTRRCRRSRPHPAARAPGTSPMRRGRAARR